MQGLLETDIAQAGGWTTVAGSLFLFIMEQLADLTVNDFLQGLMLVGSIIFLFYKIKNSRLDAKLKKKQLDKEE
jgi:hypothetical protein